jgi:hypothetical protein
MPMPELKDWMLWKQHCAAEACPPATRAVLQAFGHSRFHRYAAAYAHTTNVPEAHVLTPSPAEAWHLFESWTRLRNTRSGKAYKAWLLARPAGGESALASIESGASLLMRDVVREYLRREFPSAHIAAVTPTHPGGDVTVPSLDELLPDPDDPRARLVARDLERIAYTRVGPAFAALTPRERTALLARELNLSLAHPLVTTAAGCGKSALFKLYPAALAKIADQARLACPGEPPHILGRLAILIFDAVRDTIFSWGHAEKTVSAFFRCMEGNAPPMRDRRHPARNPSLGVRAHELAV